MTAVEDESALDAGEWGIFVARVVQEIRRELGEAAANRVATALHNQRAEAIEAATSQLRATRALHEQALSEVEEARRAHERLQADVARMDAAVRHSKADATQVRADAAAFFARHRAEADAAAEAESQRIAEAWKKVRAQEAEVAARRSELLDLDDHADRRLSEIGAVRAELEELRCSIQAERDEAQRLVEDAIVDLDAAEAEEPAVVLDLRDEAVDLRMSTLDDREAELMEWEAELVARAQQIEQRATGVTPMMPPPNGNFTGWGRRPSQTS